MKNSILIAGIIMMTFGCRQQVDLSSEIPGTYSMVSQEVQQGTKTNTYKDLRQLKIYTPTHYMYTQMNPSDSSSAFAVGRYQTSKDTLTENMIYSASDSTFNDQPASYRLSIKITPEGYNQVIKDFLIEGKNSKLTEYYNKVKDTANSPLDGVWKEVHSYTLNGTDTTWNKRTQYKSYYDGYFMFGNSALDSSGRRTTNMGYGTFVKVSDKQIKETDLNSSYPFVAGNTFTVDFEMPDKDHYIQTLTNQDGTISVESYERVK